MGHNTPHIKRKCLLEIKGKMELFNLEFRQEEAANRKYLLKEPRAEALPEE